MAAVDLSLLAAETGYSLHWLQTVARRLGCKNITMNGNKYAVGCTKFDLERQLKEQRDSQGEERYGHLWPDWTGESVAQHTPRAQRGQLFPKDEDQERARKREDETR